MYAASVAVYSFYYKQSAVLVRLFFTSAEGGYVVTSVCLSVCLPVRRITEKSRERILTKFLGGVGHGSGTKGIHFGDDPDHRPDPGVWSPKSGFTGLLAFGGCLC